MIRLPPFEDGALDIGSEKGEADKIAPPGGGGRCLQSWSIHWIPVKHRMRISQGPDQRRIRLRRVSVAGKDVGPAAPRLHPPGQGQPQLIRFRKVGHSSLTGMEAFSDLADKVEWQKQIDMLCMDLDAVHETEQVILCVGEKAAERLGQSTFKGRRGDTSRCVVLLVLLCAALQGR